MKKTPLILVIGFRLPEIIALLVVSFYSYLVLSDLTKDTTLISNAAFVICSTFSALAFGFAQVIHEKTLIKDRVVYAGERFLHAAIFLIIASIIKYAILQIFPPEISNNLPVWQNIIRYGFGSFAFVLFGWAALIAHTGIKILNKILIQRMARIKDWDNVF